MAPIVSNPNRRRRGMGKWASFCCSGTLQCDGDRLPSSTPAAVHIIIRQYHSELFILMSLQPDGDSSSEEDNHAKAQLEAAKSLKKLQAKEETLRRVLELINGKKQPPFRMLASTAQNQSSAAEVGNSPLEGALSSGMPSNA
jgi:hypothetical protein